MILWSACLLTKLSRVLIADQGWEITHLFIFKQHRWLDEN